MYKEPLSDEGRKVLKLLRLKGAYLCQIYSGTWVLRRKGRFLMRPVYSMTIDALRRVGALRVCYTISPAFVAPEDYFNDPQE